MKSWVELVVSSALLLSFVGAGRCAGKGSICPSLPVTVNLSISDAATLNAGAELTCALSSEIDVSIIAGVSKVLLTNSLGGLQ